MIFSRRRIRRLIPCVLEVILSLKAKGIVPTPDLIASRLGVNVNNIVEALNLAIREGLIVDGTYDLTEAGRSLVLSHRERFLHDKYIHKYTSPWQSFKTIRDMRAHWTFSHGLDEASLDQLHSSLSSLEGRIEEVKPLSSLSPGSKGVVAFMVGGYGFIRRLADMGLTPGVEVTVVRNAPFGGPIVVQVRGCSVALGRGVASRVFIKVLED